MSSVTPTSTKRKRKRARALRRKAALALLGSGLGLFCRFAPVEHQDLCHWSAKLLGLFLGSP